MTGTDKIIYEHLDSQLTVLQEKDGGFVFHIMGIGWCRVSVEQATDMTAKVTSAAFPFQKTARKS